MQHSPQTVRARSIWHLARRAAARIGTRIFDETVVRLYKMLARWYLAPVLLRDWKWSRYKHVNERIVEFAFAFKWLSKVCPRQVLDVGSGTTSWPHVVANCGFRVTAIDKVRGYTKGGFLNRHYYVVNDDITDSRITREFDFITCISVLEHIPNHKAALRGMFRLLRPGGHLVLTFPYNDKKYIDNVYKLPGAGYGKSARYICQVYSREEIDSWLEENSGVIVEQEYYEVFSGDFWTFGERIHPPRRVTQEARCHLTCLVIQKV